MFFYNLGIFFYRLMIGVLSPFHQKAGKMLNGRKELPSLLKKISSLRGNKKLIWFHVASLGEFEQGKPVLEKLKNKYPDAQILLTFFSPSGYEVRKDYKGADYVAYIPFDFPRSVKKFLDAVRPDCVVFVKYEFWLNFLYELNKRKVSVYLISAVFHPGQPFFRWYGNRFIYALHLFKHIFVQDESSFQLLKTLKVKNSTVGGDTRFDRVVELAESPGQFPLMDEFRKNQTVVIGGSTYETEEQMLIQLYKKRSAEANRIKLIIAPHNITNSRIEGICSQLKKENISFSLFSEGINPGTEVVIINTMGNLSHLYRYADLALIGGGFDGGIHNILEAAVYGLPVYFGYAYEKFAEAHSLLAEGAAFEVKTSSEFTEKISLLLNSSTELQRVSSIAIKYVRKNAGATENACSVIRL